LGVWQAKGFPVMDFYEIAAGKLAALLSRCEARDLFDCHQILQMADLDQERLRIAFVAYAGMNPVDLREKSKNDVEFDPKELVNNLIPVLPVTETGNKGQWIEFGRSLLEECRRALKVVLPFTKPERRFLDLLLESGEINPALLTSDPELQDRIRRHPALKWRAL
jgi:hypothetical protein